MWLLLHGWRIPLWKYPALAADFHLPAPDAVKVQAAQGPPAVQAFSSEWFPGRPSLHGGAGNNNSLL